MIRLEQNSSVLKVEWRFKRKWVEFDINGVSTMLSESQIRQVRKALKTGLDPRITQSNKRSYRGTLGCRLLLDVVDLIMAVKGECPAYEQYWFTRNSAKKLLEYLGG